MIARSSFLGRSSALAVSLACLFGASPALAQDQGDPPEQLASSYPAQAQQPTDETIVVTGSRLGRQGYDAPTPVNVIGEQRLENLAIDNVGDALNQIPSFRPINTPASNFFRVSGNIGARTLDLRGLGATRTLTLVDGRRFVPSSDDGTVDINAIPSLMVQRTEVVTGGASAAYGANAVAGVVNLILDTRLQGVKANASFGISEEGDAESVFLGLAGGTSFAGGRGHIVAGAEYAREGGIGPCEERDWCRKYTNYLPNPGYNTATRTSTNGLPATLVLDDLMFVYNENGILAGARKPNPAGGTITLGQQLLHTGATALPDALRGKQFDENGNLVPYTFGNLLSGILQQLRDPTQPYALGLSPLPLMVPTKHYSGMVHGEYELTDSITASAEFIYSRVIGGPAQRAAPQEAGIAIDINNPYLSDATRATVLAADPDITHLLLNTASWVQIPTLAKATSKVNTYRAAFALRGDFSDRWDWDAYYTYGQVKSRVSDDDNLLREWNDAIDAVRAPAGLPGIPEGEIICRTTLSNPTNGCIPVNLFGSGTISQAALDRYIVPEWQTRKFVQHAAAVNLRGTSFATWAGDVRVAAGGEWRQDKAEGDADENTLTGRFRATNFSSLPRTSTSVVEGYFEAAVPLLRDSPIGKSLDVDGAVRYTHYNRFGDATTWKLGAVYGPIPDLTFRVTRSRDIRAPSARESSPNATAINLPLPDPFVGGTTSQIVVTGGNPDLELEKGDTFTAGVVISPTFLPRFNLAIDYYDIKVKGAIDSLTGSAIANACKNQNLLCNLIVFNPNGSINTVFSNFQNLSRLHAEGIEVVSDFRVPAFGGDFDFQVNGNYVIDLSTIDATGVVTQLDNVTGNAGSVTNIQGVPRWKVDAVISYSQPAWGVTAHGRYVPRGLLDSTKIGPHQQGYDVNDPNSISENRIDARFYLDLAFRVNVKMAERTFQFYAAVNNVFDTDQPRQLRLFGNPLHFDPIGRFFKAGVRAEW